MKKIVIFSLLLSYSFINFGQIAYYDAFKLANETDQGGQLKYSSETVFSILDKYYQPKINNTKNEIVNAFNYVDGEDQNLFIEISGKSEGVRGGNANEIKDILTGSISGLNVTTIADGLAQFMISSAKEELTIVFFQRFKNFLTNYPESEALFPKTSDFIENMLAHEYTIWISTLRNKFLEDIQNLPFRIDDLLELPKYKFVVEELPEVLIFLKIIEDVQNKEHSFDIIHKITKIDALKKSTNEDSKNLLALFQTTDLISQSLRFKNDSIILKNNKDSTDIIYQDDSHLIRVTETSNRIIRDTLKTWSENSMAWVSNQHLKILTEDTIAFRIYLGLLYQKSLMNAITFYPYKDSVYLSEDKVLQEGDILCKNSIILTDTGYVEIKQDSIIVSNAKQKKGSILIHKKNDITFHEILSKQAKNIMGIRDLIETFNSVTEELDDVQDSIRYKKKHNIKLKSDDYRQYMFASLNTINFGFDIMEYIDTINLDKIEKYRTISKELANSVDNIYDKNYAEAMLNASNIFETVIEILNDKNLNKSDDIKSDYKKILKEHKSHQDSWPIIKSIKSKNVLKNEYGFTKKSSNHKKTIKNLNKYAQKTFYYGSFIARIAQADSSEAVSQIIKSIALPAGSSSLKKYQPHNVAINSYLGYALKNQTNLDFKENYLWKVYAPVGVAYTPFSFRKGGSVSLFVSLIDIGAIVDYRLKAENDTSYVITGTDTTTTITKNVEYSNKIQLGNIFSPGASVIYGFGGNIPLALSFGFQYGPGLTEINNEGNVISNPQWMYNISLTIDIPIINIHPGRRKRF
ncbi:MAG: hypothetical protein K8R54_03615 [Bacteroidales bacterium]|nr:hypothetical protein [Bacteroidales bacterium]